MTYFKYGDKIKVVRHKCWINCIGVEGKITGIYAAPFRFPELLPFYRVDLDNGASILCDFEELEAVTNAET